jgi:hypothetical protein
MDSDPCGEPAGSHGFCKEHYDYHIRKLTTQIEAVTYELDHLSKRYNELLSLELADEILRVRGANI